MHIDSFIRLVFIMTSQDSANSKTNAYTLFTKITVGMERLQVENLLGKPKIEIGDQAYYLDPPQIEKWEAPVSPGSIKIYFKNNKVQEMRFFGEN